MKKSRSARSARSSRVRKSQHKRTLVVLGAIASFVAASALGYLIWRVNTTASLTALDASANQKNIIECTDTIRDRFDNNIRVGKRYRVAGANPEGVFANNGLLRLRASSKSNADRIGAEAILSLAPTIRGNFVYQTIFAGINSSEGKYLPVAAIRVTIGSEIFYSRVVKEATGNKLIIYRYRNSEWDTTKIGAVPDQFKFRFLRRKNKVMIMTKDRTSKDPFRVIYESDLTQPDGLASIRLKSEMHNLSDYDPKDLTSTARFENFRIFCPSEIQYEWVRDDE